MSRIQLSTGHVIGRPKGSIYCDFHAERFLMRPAAVGESQMSGSFLLNIIVTVLSENDPYVWDPSIGLIQTLLAGES